MMAGHCGLRIFLRQSGFQRRETHARRPGDALSHRHLGRFQRPAGPRDAGIERRPCRPQTADGDPRLARRGDRGNRSAAGVFRGRGRRGRRAGIQRVRRFSTRSGRQAGGSRLRFGRRRRDRVDARDSASPAVSGARIGLARARLAAPPRAKSRPDSSRPVRHHRRGIGRRSDGRRRSPIDGPVSPADRPNG